MECKINGQTIEINGARIIFKNFSGKPGLYNKEGDRNFCLVLPDDAAVNFFRQNGYSPTVKPSGVEVGEFFRYLKVKLKFNQWGPTIILKSGDKRQESMRILFQHWILSGLSRLTWILDRIIGSVLTERVVKLRISAV